MAGPPTSSFVELTWKFSGTSLPNGAVITMGFTAPSGDPEEALETICDAAELVHTAIATTTCTLDSIAMKAGPVATGPTIERVVGSIGGAGSDGASPNTSVLIRKTVQSVSQRFSGRCYYPSLGASSLEENGDIVGSSRVNFGLALEDFLDTLDSELGMTPLVFSEGSSDPRVVTSYDVQTKAATQRRRLRR